MAFDLVGKAVKKLRLPTVNYDNSPIKIIPAQCGDINSRFFSVEMYDDRGDIDLSKYTTVMLNATLPDGTLQIQTGEIDQTTKTVTCKIAGSMISQSGKVTCDIALQGVDSNGDGIRLTSQTFYIFAANSQSDDSAIEGDDDYGLLMQLLNEVSQVEAEIKTAEQSRVTAETQRVSAENTRKSQETTRVNQETSRVNAEKARVTAEDGRVATENARVSAEDARRTTESQRVTAENARAKAEESRVSVEKSRVSAESGRVTAEQGRVDAEEARVAAEQSRVTAETQRVSEFSAAKKDCETATEKANDIYDAITETLDALPCSTEVVDGSTTSSIVTLRFIKLGG